MTDPIERVASWVIEVREQALSSFASGGAVCTTIVPLFDPVICEAGQHDAIHLVIDGTYKLTVEQIERIKRFAAGQLGTRRSQER